MTVKPITPREAVSGKTFPDHVIAAFNELIVKHLRAGSASFRQGEVVDLILSKVPVGARKKFRDEIFENCWLDVEELYESAGWKVTFDQPGYNETYPATFTFQRRRP